jgi:hypothetical protein
VAYYPTTIPFHHRSQWLSYFMGDRRREGVPGHQAHLTLASPSKDRAEQSRVEGCYLIQQDDQDEIAG